MTRGRSKYLKDRFKQVGRGAVEGVPMEFALKAIDHAYAKQRINRSEHAAWKHIIQQVYRATQCSHSLPTTKE